MNQAALLFQYQVVDSEIERLQARIAEIDAAIAADQQIAHAEQVLADSRKAHQHAALVLRAAEENVKSLQIKISTSEANLYGGRIKNPKELQDLQTEIASLKKRLAAVEDEQLTAMVNLEEAELGEKKASENLILARGQVASRNAEMLGEKEQAEQKISRLSTERNAHLTSLDPSSLEIYRTLRKQKRGVAVVSAADGACSACGAELRPAELQAARSPQGLAYCSTCGRILYAG